jgi:hypothetical protein
MLVRAVRAYGTIPETCGEALDAWRFVPTTFWRGDTGKAFYNTRALYFRFRKCEGGVFNGEFAPAGDTLGVLHPPWRRGGDHKGCEEVSFI